VAEDKEKKSIKETHDEERKAVVSLEQKEDYEFLVKFESGQELLMDEPEPLGKGAGPNAARVLSAAVGNCLSASLLFCLQKSRVDAGDVKTTVTTHIRRNENKRFRIGKTEVRIDLNLPDEASADRANRCLGLFEDFCIVTASVRKGIDVAVEVYNKEGEKLFESTD